MKNIQFEMVNGEKVYSFNCIVDSQRRPAPPAKTPGVQDGKPDKVENAASDDGATTNSSSSEPPQDGLVRDDWRLISAVEAWPSSDFWLPQLVDYSHDGGKVLKDVVPLVNVNHPDVTWNHSRDAKDIAGYVENAAWEDSKDIPVGVNGTLVVDPTYDNKAATGLQKGVIRNGSIGFQMHAKPSHPKMAFEDFIAKQGKIVNGEKVRWIPQKITNVLHMAMVPAGAGADPNAGKRNGQGTQNVATNINNNGGLVPMKEVIALLTAICQSLGIEVALVEDSPIPADLEERATKKAQTLSEIQGKYNSLVSKVQEIGSSILTEGETSLTADATLARLPEVISMSKHGARLLAHQRAEALKFFDAAKISGDKKELTEAEKRLRGRIENCDDLDMLSDWTDEYRPQAEARFGNRRTSENEELPPDTKTTVKRNPDIEASTAKMFGKKESK